SSARDFADAAHGLAAVAAGVRQCDADDTELGAVWISYSDSSYRRDRKAHGDYCAGAVCAAADFAQHVRGIASVDAAVCESAVAMGMTSGQMLRQVQLPLAAPTILAGIRVATVATIGTATIAAAIGGGGLGVFIFRGVASVDTVQILAGAVPAALIALAADWGLGWVERKLSSL